MVAGGDDGQLDGGVLRVAEHADDFAAGLALLGGVLHDTRHHGLAVGGALGFSGGDEQLLHDARFEGGDEPRAARLLESARDGFMGAVEHADDAPLGPSVGAAGLHAADHAVAVHGLVEIAGADEDVGQGGIGGDHESVAVAVALHDAGDQVHFFRQAVARAADVDDEPFGGQFADAAARLGALIALDLEPAHDLAQGQRTGEQAFEGFAEVGF